MCAASSGCKDMHCDGRCKELCQFIIQNGGNVKHANNVSHICLLLTAVAYQYDRCNLCLLLFSDSHKFIKTQQISPFQIVSTVVFRIERNWFRVEKIPLLLKRHRNWMCPETFLLENFLTGSYLMLALCLNFILSKFYFGCLQKKEAIHALNKKRENEIR